MANEIGLTEVSATSMDVIASLVQQTLKQESKLLPYISDFSQFAVKGAGTVKVPRRTQFAAADKSENTDLTAQVLTFAVDTISLNKNKAIYSKLERVAEVQASPNVEAEIILEMAKELALQVDKDIYAQLLLASSAAPDHRIAYVGSTLAQADILEGMRLLKVQSVPMSDVAMVISPKDEKSILAVADFIRADGANFNPNPLQTGIIGKVYGMPIIVTNVATDDRAILFHKSSVGYASELQPEFSTNKDLKATAKEYLLQMIYGVTVLDSGKRQVLLGSAT